MNRTNDPSDAKQKRLVGPCAGLSPEEQAYWDHYNALVSAYVSEKGGDVEPEGIGGLHSLGMAPWVQIEWGKDWPLDWCYRFDAQTLAHLHGRTLLMEDIVLGGLMEGDDEAVVVDEIAAFVAWLGREGHVPAAVAERFGSQLAEARPAFLEAMAEKPVDDLWKDREPEEVAGPFVGYLRTRRGFAMEKMLLGQSLCIDALEQLRCATVEDAPWSALDLYACVQYTARQLPYLELAARDLGEVAQAFLDWLSDMGRLSPSVHRQLSAQVRKALR